MEDSVPARNPRVVHSRLADGEAVLLHLELRCVPRADPIGAAIWDRLEDTATRRRELRRAGARELERHGRPPGLPGRGLPPASGVITRFGGLTKWLGDDSIEERVQRSGPASHLGCLSVTP